MVSMATIEITPEDGVQVDRVLVEMKRDCLSANIVLSLSLMRNLPPFLSVALCICGSLIWRGSQVVQSEKYMITIAQSTSMISSHRP